MNKTIAAGLMGALFATGAGAADMNYASKRVLEQSQNYTVETPIRDSMERYSADVKKFPPIKQTKKHGLGPEYWALGAALMGSTVADYEMTFKNKKDCEAYIESLPNAIVTRPCGDVNPVAMPLVNSGRAVAYGVNAAANAGVMYVSAEMKKNGSKIWWVPMALPIAAHTYGAIKNSKGFKINITIVK